MLASIHFTLRTLVLTSVAVLAVGCSAEAASPDAGGDSIDARTSQPRADAMPFDRADANVLADAAPDCVDSNEPNETSAAAFSLSATPISDSTSAKNPAGTFTGSALGADIDWYTYEGSDDLGPSVNPSVEVVPADKVEVCMFFDCINPASPRAFTCPDGSMAASDGDLAGCCANSGFIVDGVDCTGISDDAKVYIRVKAIVADVCENYAVTYSY